MHQQVRDFINYVKTNFPNSFANVNVLDFGCGDINGNNREYFVDSEYTGNDVANGPNVDLVCKTKDLTFSNENFDTIISTECLEHDAEYTQSLQKAYDMLKDGGMLVFTCASTGRREHGTRRTTPNDCLATLSGDADFQDYYKNLTIEDVIKCIDLNQFSYWRSYYNMATCDLYFVGIKGSGEVSVPPDYTDPWVKNTTIDPASLEEEEELI